MFKIARILNFDSLNETLSTSLNEKMEFENVCFYFEISNIFKGNDTSLNFIERWFSVMAETNQFFYYSIDQMTKIFASSCLNITSEQELVNVANKWIKRDPKQRKQFAIELIKKIRLPLLSYAGIELILKNKSFFSQCVKCKKHIKDVIREKNNPLIIPASINYQTRYCSQTNFALLVSRREVSNSQIYYGKSDKRILYESHEGRFARTLTTYIYSDTVVAVLLVNGVLYFLTEDSICRYTFLTKCQLVVEKLPRISSGSSAIGFMGNLFILGGYRGNCVYFEPETKDWCEITAMTEERIHSGCTIFEGQIIVSGGALGSRESRKTVETYDFFTNVWSPMPDMLEARSHHASVSIGHKLFMIGGTSTNSCEMYDSFTKKFVNIKAIAQFDKKFPKTMHCVTMGSKLIAFSNDFPLKAAEYDVEKDEWSVKKLPVNLPTVREEFYVLRVPEILNFWNNRLPY